MIFHLLEDALRNSILISGLVVIMMMMIESLNIESRGNFFSAFSKSRIGGVLTGALLGVIPGCLGGFATVSLYTHGLLSFGALVAMMIASAGDEAFVMLALVPKDAVWIFCLLFGIAVVSGIVTDVLFRNRDRMRCTDNYSIHVEDNGGNGVKQRHFGWKRAVLFAGVIIFLAALVTGHLEHEHGAADVHEELAGGMNLLSEDWMNIMFAILSILVLVMLITGSDHFVEEHLWRHVVVKHLPNIFAWTFGVLVLVGLLLNCFDIAGWISDNTLLMILLATAIGIIPESGPHLIFVTLYASGVVPLPVLLASCVSQDGHAALPLIAESKKSFLKAKAVNCAVALATGLIALALPC